MLYRPLSILVPLLLLASTSRAQDTPKLTARGSSLQVVEPDQNDRDLRTTPVVRAVQKAADSVVSIYVQDQHALAGREPMTQGQGSGVILDESGLVITNWHVIQPLLDPRLGLSAAVKLRDGRTLPATLLSQSATHDLALLQIRLDAGDKVKPIEIGRSGDLMIGETLIAIGNPQGHANTVTVGVLSATGRTITVRAPDNNLREYPNLLQTDAAINEGNSGGALLDITGKLIGINNAMARGAENIGFAIPMDTVREVFEQELTQSGSFATAMDVPWLGFDVVERGGTIVVSSVLVGSPADSVGVEPGDVLLRAKGRQVASSLDLQRELVSASFDEPIPLVLRRDSRELEVAARPTTRTSWLIRRAIGLDVEQVEAKDDQALVRKATIAYFQGQGYARVPLLPSTLRIRAVEKDSPAEGVLKPGDLILGYVARTAFGESDQVLVSTRKLEELLRGNYGRSVRLAILRGDEGYYSTLDVRNLTKRQR